LLRQGPKVLGEEAEKKINEAKQKLKAKNKKELQLLEDASQSCKQLIDLQIDENKISLVKEELKLLNNEFFNVKGISTREAGEVRKLIKEVIEKSDKLVSLRETIDEVDEIEKREKAEKNKLATLQQASSSKIEESRENYGLCSKCRKPNTGNN